MFPCKMLGHVCKIGSFDAAAYGTMLSIRVFHNYKWLIIWEMIVAIVAINRKVRPRKFTMITCHTIHCIEQKGQWFVVFVVVAAGLMIF